MCLRVLTQSLWLLPMIGLAIIGCEGEGTDSTGAMDATASSPETAATAPADTGTRGDLADGEAAPVTDARVDIQTPPVDGPAVDATDSADSSLDAADGGPCVPGTGCTLEKQSVCEIGLCNDDGLCVATPILGCCVTHDDCQIPEIIDGLSACDVRRCDDLECVTVATPGCCESELDCEETHPCAEATCNGATLHCAVCPVDCLCKETAPIFSEDFNVTKLSNADFLVYKPYWSTITWQPVSTRWARPPKSAYLGRPDCMTYYDGAMTPACEPVDPTLSDAKAVHGSLKTPDIFLEADTAGHVALFWLWADVDPLKGLAAGEPDVLRVLVEDASLGTSNAWPVASSLDVGKDTADQWALMAVDLHPWRGQNVRLHFDFNSLDGHDNHHEGVYVDEVQVIDRCVGGCCQQDSDCPDDDDPCTAARCLTMSHGAGQVCANVYATPGEDCEPCTGAAECDDGNPCTDDACSPAGVCSHGEFCCLQTELWTDGFEAGLLAWSLEDSQSDDDVQWHITTASDSPEGAKSAWFGDPATGTYAGAGPVMGTLTTEGIMLTPADSSAASPGLRFQLKMSTEWDGQSYVNPAGLDRLTLEVVEGGSSVEIWSSDSIDGSTDGAWIEVEVGLAAWSNELIFLRWTFDSGDGIANDHQGPLIDDVRVGTFCP